MNHAHNYVQTDEKWSRCTICGQISPILLSNSEGTIFIMQLDRLSVQLLKQGYAIKEVR